MDEVDLQAIPLFAGLSGDERARLARAARPLRFQPGDVIVHEREFSFDLYAIVRGDAEVQRSGEHVANLAAGDVFGEIGVLGGGRGSSRRRGATVIARAKTEVIVLDGELVRRMTAEVPALAEAIHALVARRSGYTRDM
jgi:CRP-like cAMP-binding protein